MLNLPSLQPKSIHIMAKRFHPMKKICHATITGHAEKASLGAKKCKLGADPGVSQGVQTMIEQAKGTIY